MSIREPSALNLRLFESFCRSAQKRADVAPEKIGLRKAVRIAVGDDSPSLDFPECLVEHLGTPTEGSAISRGAIGVFRPEDQKPEYWAVGAQGRLRFPGGSLRILVLGENEGELLFARAPARRERRQFQRAPAQGIAVVKLCDVTNQFDLSDVSEGGLGLEGSFAVEVGQTLQLLLKLEGREALPLECEGIVRSCRQVTPFDASHRRIGLEFTTVSDSLVAEIRNRVRQSFD